jgi:dienelactone hydrolase
LPSGLIFAGFSMGTAHAELLAATRPGASGAVLMHDAAPVKTLSEFFGVERWPEGVPVQVHYTADDPWVEAEDEVAPSATTSEVPGQSSRSTSTPARATSSQTRTCRSTLAPPRRRCGNGGSRSWIRSTPGSRSAAPTRCLTWSRCRHSRQPRKPRLIPGD